ncbi:MAG: type IV toxin-antitoxin system AbiEi family antitoxin domain-containing protein [Archangiaceae bacterium]|nr:type IV toxin-antitoxin system AbiEi family antitoxin domain-containing protein [Archangiaceae bacterium]
MTGFARLAVLASRQHGVFTTADALAAGVSRKEVFGAVRAGRCRKLMPRVYAMTGAAKDGEQLPLQVAGARLLPSGMLQELTAVVAWGGKGAALSHRTAALLHGFEGPELGAPELTVPMGRSIVNERRLPVNRSFVQALSPSCDASTTV